MSKKTTHNDKNVIVHQTTLVQNNRQSLDIGKWKSALVAAENINNPNRVRLYDIYSNIIIDSHLMAVIQKRKLPILNAKIQLNTKNIKIKEGIEKYTGTSEFKKFFIINIR